MNNIVKKLKKGKYCVILDIVLYAPCEDAPVLEVGVVNSDATVPLYDAVLNHRYSDKNYYTFSQIQGETCCRYGYPLFLDYTEGISSKLKLAITVGAADKKETYYFSFVSEPTKTENITLLKIKVMKEDEHYSFELSSALCMYSVDELKIEKTIGYAIKQVRLSKNISRKEFAKMSGVTAVTLYNIENDVKTPTMKIIEKICKSLNIKFSELERIRKNE